MFQVVMEPAFFFVGDHVGMKCQQETFHVSSCYGTCFFLVRRLELDLFELQELYAEKADMAGYLARDDDAMEDVAKEILGISLELFLVLLGVFFFER